MRILRMLKKPGSKGFWGARGGQGDHRVQGERARGFRAKAAAVASYGGSKVQEGSGFGALGLLGFKVLGLVSALSPVARKGFRASVSG